MQLENIGDTIATRRLYVPGESDREITVAIGRPVPDKESIGYCCPFQISGIGSEKLKYAKGLDAVQALQGVMVLIGADLQFLNETVGGKLRWEGDDKGGLGFPSL
jgi:hypothetical protein